jgi:diamine N-acetyltransferase
MTTVTLRDIVTDADMAAVLRLQRKPGQERYLGSMASHFEDAIEDARACPRYWSVHDGERLVGFVMISDNIEDLGDDLVGPYYLWRLLVDEGFQGRGYGAATIDAVVGYLRTRPNADILWTSCAKGEGGPLPFYLHYGFELVGDVQFDDDAPEHLLRLDLGLAEGLAPDRVLEAAPQLQPEGPE